MSEAASREAYARAMSAAMERMMRDMHAAGHSGDPDRDFLAMMIPHHEGAVEMARLQLVHGRDPASRRLAEDIVAGQTTEIAAMRGRLALLRGEARPGGETYPELGGVRGAAAGPAPGRR